jgi:hypothetical protein
MRRGGRCCSLHRGERWARRAMLMIMNVVVPAMMLTTLPRDEERIDSSL